ncbi:hypothetical protein ID866_2427 [Astraeus odoratus]|nr:hypothetical protein ID866_2427 [Astraeus odoratus]
MVSHAYLIQFDTLTTITTTVTAVFGADFSLLLILSAPTSPRVAPPARNTHGLVVQFSWNLCRRIIGRFGLSIPCLYNDPVAFPQRRPHNTDSYRPIFFVRTTVCTAICHRQRYDGQPVVIPFVFHRHAYCIYDVFFWRRHDVSERGYVAVTSKLSRVFRIVEQSNHGTDVFAINSGLISINGHSYNHTIHLCGAQYKCLSFLGHSVYTNNRVFVLDLFITFYRATVTGSTTVYVTTTNVQGQTITSAPSVVTQVLTSTNGVGAVTTVTAAVVNPTLAPNNATTDATSFFNNTGAVVGVFVVVGLAVASILLWILFAARRRYRMRQIEHESAIQAAVAAAGFNRTPLDDDDDNGHTRSPHSHSQYSEMGQRGSYAFSSLPTAGPPLYDDIHGGFNPYADYPMIPQANRGYVPARTASPPPGAERPAPSAIGTGTEDLGSTRDRKSSYGHTPTYSAGSFEPLLSNYAQNPDPLNPPPTPPPRNPQRLIDASNPRDRTTSSASFPSPDNEHPLNVGVDNRLDPDVGRLTRSNSLGTAAIRDNEDYSRPILTVSNCTFPCVPRCSMAKPGSQYP